MHLTKMILSGFRCFPPEKSTEITFDQSVTLLIGPNGAGKTASLLALARLFGAYGRHRGITRNDFYVGPQKSGSPPPDTRDLTIEAWFDLPEFGDEKGDHDVGPYLLHELCCDDDARMRLRIRLEAQWIADGSTQGRIEEQMYAIMTTEDNVSDYEKIRIRKSTRNRFHVHYIPAHRDPARELSAAATTLLGRVLAAARWQKTEEIEKSLFDVGAQMTGEQAAAEIEQALQSSWSKLNNKSAVYETINLRFVPQDLHALVDQVQVTLAPDDSGDAVETSRLGDGHRSLLYLSVIETVYELESSLRKLPRPTPDPWDVRKLPSPCFTLFALEEPENHLAPHLLGRIVRQLRDLASGNPHTQAVVTSHSSSVVSRVDPAAIRYLRSENGISSAASISLPEKDSDAEKLIAGTLRAYPELFFAQAVVLGEGESERLVLPRMLATVPLSGDLQAQQAIAANELDDMALAVIPIGGGHVNHWWRLLYSIGVPCVTLLDLDTGRAHGGAKRMLYILRQMESWHPSPVVKQWATNQIRLAPIKEEARDGENAGEESTGEEAADEETTDEGGDDAEETGDEEIWLNNVIPELEELGVFFSYPLDLDYSMLRSFPAAYKMKVGRQRGPARRKIGDVEKSIFKSKKRRKGLYDDDDLHWYDYLFLGERSKPVTHIRALGRIADVAGWRNDAPPELVRLVKKLKFAVEPEGTLSDETPSDEAPSDEAASNEILGRLVSKT